MIPIKTVVIVSDLHCGSIFGLTPPGWFYRKRHKLYPLQSEAWKEYCAITQKWKWPDILIVNGDLIEGRQSKQGGAELLLTDRNVQADMATICLKKWNACKTIILYGSSYHTSEEGEDFEYTIAQRLNAEIGGRLFIKIEDIMFDVRHDIGGSSVPHGRGTALLRAMMWNLVKSSEKAEPRADVIVRSHRHYHIWIEQPNRVMFTTPCLQLSRGRYGSRRCEGETHWGAIRLKIHKNQIVGRDIWIRNLLGNKQKTIKIK